MEQYKKWLEEQIEKCLNDKDLQREHWAYCTAYRKLIEALPIHGVSGSGPTDDEINAQAKLTCNQYDTHTGRIIHQAAYETGARWARNIIRAASATAKGEERKE